MTEPEPTGWELMRALRDLRTSVDKMTAGMVSQALFAAHQQAQKETDDRQNARIRDLETEADERDKETRRMAEEQRKTRAQLLTSIGLAAFGVVGSIISAIVAWSVTQGLQQIAGG